MAKSQIRIRWVLITILITSILLLLIAMGTNQYLKEKTRENQEQTEMFLRNYRFMRESPLRKKIRNWIKQDKNDAKIRKQIEKQLQKYNSPFGKSYIESVIRIGRASKIPGFSRWVISLGGVESTFGQRYPAGSYNPYGIGSPNPSTWSGFNSWDSTHIKLAQLLLQRGIRQVQAETIPQISRFYAASPHHANSTIHFWNEL